jgi:hypothetical protein
MHSVHYVATLATQQHCAPHNATRTHSTYSFTTSPSPSPPPSVCLTHPQASSSSCALTILVGPQQMNHGDPPGPLTSNLFFSTQPPFIQARTILTCNDHDWYPSHATEPSNSASTSPSTSFVIISTSPGACDGCFALPSIPVAPHSSATTLSKSLRRHEGCSGVMNQLWYKYVYLEGLLENIAGAWQILE